jgi:predicted membrane metal-binding protein
MQGLSPQLSFLSVAGLIGAARATGGAWALLGAPAGAFLATAPLCVETFGRVQPLGVLITPLLVPWVGLLLGVGLLAIVPLGLLRGLDPVSATLLDAAAGVLTELLGWLAVRLPAPVSPPVLPVPGWLASLAIVAALNLLAWVRPTHDRWSGRVA